MKREIIVTKDGSHSISIPEIQVNYHSLHGAIQESRHIFIEAGLLDAEIFRYIGVHAVLEVGFGTGLNALLTLIEADKHQNRIYYTAIEPFPLDENQIRQLNYCEQLGQSQYQPCFERMHECGWEEMFEISEYFRLTKNRSTLETFSSKEQFNIIYFDAFAPTAQPELWAAEIFKIMYDSLLPGGVLVTYCSKSDVRRAMIAAGFIAEKIPGPWGKREMLRAHKMIADI